MDQDAFRSLLSQPRQGGEPSRSRGTLGGAKKDRFNRKPKGRSLYEFEKSVEKEAAMQFRPRAAKPQRDESEYKDRAAMRRKGDGGEYKHVEQVLADFERRKEEAGTDADKVESQRAFLGGDAEHSVLVKGLDFALLAKRKAELEAEKGNKVEDELDALGSSLKPKAAPPPETKKERKESNKFKSIGDKDKGKGKEQPLSLAERERRFKEQNKRRSPSPPRRKRTPSPPPNPEEEEDIFADAGAYDLNAGRESDDDSDEEGEVAERGRSRSRSRDSRSRSRSRDSRPKARDSRSRSWSRDRRRDYSRSRSRSYDRYEKRRYDSPPRRRYSRSRSRSYDRYDSRDRRRYSPSPPRRRYRSPSRTPPRKRAYSRSPSPRRRSPSPRRRSPSPKRQRQRTRSLSPAGFDPAFLHSPSDSEDEDRGPVARLRPLEGGSVSARDLLAMDEGRAAADQRAVRKFKMRAAQGLGAQDGFDMGLLHDKKNEGHRLNREYQAVMNHVKKKEKEK